MKDIYILCKLEEIEKTRSLISDFCVKNDTNNVNFHVITDLDEIPIDHRQKLEVFTGDKEIQDIDDAIRKTIELHTEADFEKMKRIIDEHAAKLKENARVYEAMSVDRTDYQKLAEFDRKAKNEARRKLEKQALKYQNRHWKK